MLQAPEVCFVVDDAVKTLAWLLEDDLEASTPKLGEMDCLWP